MYSAQLYHGDPAVADDFAVKDVPACRTDHDSLIDVSSLGRLGLMEPGGRDIASKDKQLDREMDMILY
jgi:hypothetical protein